jgi:hypothetical protein
MDATDSTHAPAPAGASTNGGKMTENECKAPRCERPVAESEGLSFCEEHRAYFDASYEYDEWTICAKEWLPIFIKHAEALGNDALEAMFRENLERATIEAKRCKAEMDRMYASL